MHMRGRARPVLLSMQVEGYRAHNNITQRGYTAYHTHNAGTRHSTHAQRGYTAHNLFQAPATDAQ